MKRCERIGHNVPKGFQQDYPDAVVEVCYECGEKLVYNKSKNGNIDNTKYYKDHLRYFVQPKGKTAGLYAEIYGRPKETDNPEHFYKEREEKRLEDFQRLMRATGNMDWYKKHKSIIERA